MSDVNQRISALEARLENALALDARLKSIEGDLRKVKGGSSLRDWLQTFGPYISGVLVVIATFVVKDSVTLAMQRETLDLEYVKQMRDLVKDFNESSTPAIADANAVGLAMFGKSAIIPLVERLDQGDVAKAAAQKGLRLVGGNDPVNACPKFVGVVADASRRYRWQTHLALIEVMGQSACQNARPTLEKYRADLEAIGTDQNRATAFRSRYSMAEDFGLNSVSELKEALDRALEILAAQQVST